MKNKHNFKNSIKNKFAHLQEQAHTKIFTATLTFVFILLLVFIEVLIYRENATLFLFEKGNWKQIFINREMLKL